MTPLFLVSLINAIISQRSTFLLLSKGRHVISNAPLLKQKRALQVGVWNTLCPEIELDLLITLGKVFGWRNE